MKTPEEIADHHLDLWFRDGVSVPSDGKPSLRERVIDAIREALDDPAESPLYIPVTLHIQRMEELEKKFTIACADRHLIASISHSANSAGTGHERLPW